uniref:Alpha-conotoxin-like n=1 Tax=Conus caracteristicus TaxID=89440 RepID=S4UKI0_CONCB|nr:A superfamily conotoxin Ca1.3 precursor [Conus caracteristicus]
MGMRMMFTVFLLVALATTVVPFTSDRASASRNAATDNKASELKALNARIPCCSYPACAQSNIDLCGGRR